MENKLYINVEDYQGGTWALGQVGTIQEWKEMALSWCDSDENWEMYDFIEKHKNNVALLDYISDYWSIKIVEFDENNQEHLKKQRSVWQYV